MVEVVIKSSRKYVPPSLGCFSRNIFHSVAMWTIRRVEAPGNVSNGCRAPATAFSFTDFLEAPGWGWQLMRFWMGTIVEQVASSLELQKQNTAVLFSEAHQWHPHLTQAASFAPASGCQSIRWESGTIEHDSTFSKHQGTPGVFHGDQQQSLARQLTSEAPGSGWRSLRSCRDRDAKHELEQTGWTRTEPRRKTGQSKCKNI